MNPYVFICPVPYGVSGINTLSFNHPSAFSENQTSKTRGTAATITSIPSLKIIQPICI
ncbi:MAG: hypothetical protein M1481_07165 [Candidatus Thermoplasmatota archaeon]|nr:hypothetical protein [Candidatus Thermoplasmatota archaeon]MCL5963911.1 hypothetical protein [Candidatus Thermoplasmatota archaeon]